MMDWTDPHDRFFLRQCSRHTLLYTEMVPAQAVWFGKAERFLAHQLSERPVAVQFGGSDPRQLELCARLAGDWAYDEVNLNVGCPSDRVQSGRFGACLMAEPQLVAELVAAMRGATSLPVTVKTRIGIDDMDSEAELFAFIEAIRASGARTVIIHARKAWLQGLSPKQNREIPPLCYQRVFAVKDAFPDMEVIINGGVQSLDEAAMLLERVDGVMMGRAAYHNPYLLAEADRRIFGDAGSPVATEHELVEAYLPYVEARLAEGERLSRMTRHIVGLFQGRPGARRWRRYLSEHGPRRDADSEVIRAALALVSPEIEREAVSG